MAKSTKIHKTETDTAEERALNEAIERVYRKYGSDLRAFFQDVREELITREKKISSQPQMRW